MTILATIIVLGVLIFVHELGHFAAAKLVGVEVQRFSIGLGPRLFGFQWGETDYVFSAIPLGGYVKMGGMDDEVMDRLEGGPLREPRQAGPRDFDGKPIWARTLVISAGVIMNMLFAFAVYASLTAAYGLPEISTTRVARVVRATLPAGAETLADIPEGARLVRIGDRETHHWGDVQDAFLELPPGPVTVETTNPALSLDVRVPASHEERVALIGSLGHWVEPGVGAVNPGSPADKAGIEAGDQIVAVAGRPVRTWYDVVDLVEDRAGVRTEFTLRREGREIIRAVTPEATQERRGSGVTVTVGKVGIYQPPDPLTYTDASVGQALVAGYRQTMAVTGMILGFLRDLVTGGVSPKSMGSIVTIGTASGQAAAAGLDSFLRFMALFSVNLAILNLLPIPVLDGGHLLFLGIEAVRGRALSVEQRLRWSNVGLFIVMGLMLWALSNDVFRLLGL